MPPDAGDGQPRVFFYVQHLLGIGHLLRAARIVRALAADGFDVLLVLGGVLDHPLDVGTACVLQLPPVKVGAADFGALVHADGKPFDSAAKARRTARLIDAFDRFEPDLLVTEAFPFGRSQMRFELMPLLARAKSRARPPLIVASVRDILQRQRSAKRTAETVDLVQRFFDLILVHGDPTLVTLKQTFPRAGEFAAKLAYTGLVAPDPALLCEADELPSYATVVSAGGGAVGLPLLEAALRARPLTGIADQPWLLLTGPNLPPDARALLSLQAAGTVSIETFVPDLARTIARAAVSVSQAGYNTVADVLAGGSRAVLVPYAEGGETEQTDRAAILASRGAAWVVPEASLTPERLAAAIDGALASPSAKQQIDLSGAPTTARILRQRLVSRNAGSHRAEASDGATILSGLPLVN